MQSMASQLPSQNQINVLMPLSMVPRCGGRRLMHHAIALRWRARQPVHNSLLFQRATACRCHACHWSRPKFSRLSRDSTLTLGELTRAKLRSTPQPCLHGQQRRYQVHAAAPHLEIACSFLCKPRCFRPVTLPVQHTMAVLGVRCQRHYCPHEHPIKTLGAAACIMSRASLNAVFPYGQSAASQTSQSHIAIDKLHGPC